MDLGRIGVWSGELRYGDEGVARDAAAQLEAAGYGAIWLPGGFDQPFAAARALLDATERIVLATGIVNVWGCPAKEAAAAHAELTAAHPGRFLLGLGISHAPMIDREQPGRYARLFAVMNDYLDELDAATPPVPATERALAALGPQMLRLAAARTAGSHPYLVPPEHTRAAREALGPDALLAPEQGVVLESDPVTARAAARQHLSVYLGLPNYVNNWFRYGLTEDDVRDGGSDRLVDTLIAWGDETVIAERVAAHRDAGADHVCIQVFGAPQGELPLDQWRRLADALR